MISRLREEVDSYIGLAQEYQAALGRTATGLATVGVYCVLGWLLYTQAIPLAVAATAVVALQAAHTAVGQVAQSITRLHEQGMFIADYDQVLATCCARTPPVDGSQAPITRWPLTARAATTLGVDPDRVDAEQLGCAARSTGADHVVDELPKGWDTLLSKQFVQGCDLSGGQWQRLARGRTVILVTHRLGTVHMADQILGTWTGAGSWSRAPTTICWPQAAAMPSSTESRPTSTPRQDDHAVGTLAHSRHVGSLTARSRHADR